MPPEDLRAVGYERMLRSTIGQAMVELWRGRDGFCVRRSRLVLEPDPGVQTDDVYRDDQPAAQAQNEAWLDEELRGS